MTTQQPPTKKTKPPTTLAKAQTPAPAQSLQQPQPEPQHHTPKTPTDTTTTTITTMTTPRRALFIASIGNQKPYRSTRHSAGHILLDALTPLLNTTPAPLPFNYYTTWYSPSFMNESGPKLVRQLQRWFEKIDTQGQGSQWISSSGVALPLGGDKTPTTSIASAGGGMPATLVILHDELEQPLGKIRVKRGGPEASSLRGHRGLISVCESLRGKGLYPSKSGVAGNGNNNGKGNGKGGVRRDLSILRVGVGIGRPESRGKNAVADYVLTEMDGREMEAVRRAAGHVVGVLEEEIVFEG
ncbi:aminoacyl-tRNA hydrolase [Penicillium waksmanii]|uniref:aminoacyl-tRNA hydrolase n=1 Tax=Penicillium waksmanii TaxID=69791 RepID=UPI0025489708|nr:aminoacyl-tRNA hydrolase [Penicillium waksmanii]KAJ5984499.1 aminoacyl-tRNA hydrolase [Penicillium waksmanii]